MRRLYLFGFLVSECVSNSLHLYLIEVDFKNESVSYYSLITLSFTGKTAVNFFLNIKFVTI